MEENKMLYAYYKEATELQTKHLLIENEIKKLECTKHLLLINLKLDQYHNYVDNLLKCLKQINNSKVLIKVQANKMLSPSPPENTIKISHKHRQDFLQLLQNLKEFEKIVDSPELQQTRALEYFNNRFHHHSALTIDDVSRLVENFVCCKGFYENICALKNNTDCNKDELSDTDLGCYPHDSSSISSNEINTPQSNFASSSPISLIEKK